MWAIGVYSTSDYVQIINRGSREIVSKIQHPNTSETCLQLMPIMYYDYQQLPYIFVRDKQFVTLIDLQDTNKKGHRVLKIDCENYLY